jgi:hypothetical protein
MKPKLSPWIIALGLLCATGASAQAPPLPPAAFDMVGFVQEATLDGSVAGTATTSLQNTDPRAGGTMTINGIKMLVPNNTLVQMPAFALSWQQLFDPAFSAAIAVPGMPVRPNHPAGQTGLALNDNPQGSLPDPFPSFEVRAVGNINPNPANGTPRYIVGGLLVPLTQQGLNGGFGVINFIDYTTGRLRVGGILNDPNCTASASSPACSGAVVEINDPAGRWGKAHSPDPRFTTDTNNPTVLAASGYPVCVPRVAPPVVDLECPITNRPANPALGTAGHDPFLAAGAPMKTFTMPAAPGGPGTTTPDPWKQVPLRVGDVIDFSGTLYKFETTDPYHNALLPATAPANMYISAHTLEADLGIFTAPGVKPCYVRVEALTIPTAQIVNQPLVSGGNPITNIPLENSTRVHIVGFTTDPSRRIDIKAIDVNPTTGAETERTVTSVLPETFAPGLVRGRFRFQVSKTSGFFPATREYIAKSQTGQVVAANGLTTGQYRLPCFDFLFAERTVFGNPTVPNHFNMIPFLFSGSGPIGGFGTATPVVGKLDPWPGP